MFYLYSVNAAKNNFVVEDSVKVINAQYSELDRSYTARQEFITAVYLQDLYKKHRSIYFIGSTPNKALALQILMEFK